MHWNEWPLYPCLSRMGMIDASVIVKGMWPLCLWHSEGCVASLPVSQLSERGLHASVTVKSAFLLCFCHRKLGVESVPVSQWSGRGHCHSEGLECVPVTIWSGEACGWLSHRVVQQLHSVWPKGTYNREWNLPTPTHHWNTAAKHYRLLLKAFLADSQRYNQGHLPSSPRMSAVRKALLKSFPLQLY